MESSRKKLMIVSLETVLDCVSTISQKLLYLDKKKFQKEITVLVLTKVELLLIKDMMFEELDEKDKAEVCEWIKKCKKKDKKLKQEVKSSFKKS